MKKNFGLNRTSFPGGENYSIFHTGGAAMGRWTPRVDGAHAAQVLRMAIEHRTIPVKDPEEEAVTPFLALQEGLSKAYPALFSAAHTQVVAGGSLLMLLPGAQKARPLLFLGHLDVHSVEEEELSQWTYPPFEGAEGQGFVWGRGAWEGKGRLIALCEAAESLLKNGWRPSADIWFAFSQDAGVCGSSAKQMCRILQAQGVEPAFILDGGGAVEDEFAYVGVAEKGYADITLSIAGEGGCAHDAKQPTGFEKLIFAAADVARHPMKPKLCQPVEWMLKSMANHLPPVARLMAAYPRLFWPILRAGHIVSSAQIRSTAVPVQFKGSTVKAMIARQTSVTYHCRILPGDTVEDVIAHLRDTAGFFGDIRLTVLGAERPSGLSPATGPAWEALATAIQILWPQAAPVPCLYPGTTDARCYEELGGNIYRFSPFRTGEEEGPRSINERISLENLELGIQFYQQMLQA
jgi:carboxypeptidase PM20D1